MLELARTLVRTLDPAPGRRIALALPHEGLADAVGGLLAAAGTETVDTGGAHGCMVQLGSVRGAVPHESRPALELVSTGGRVVAVVLNCPGSGPAGEAEDYWRPRLHCDALESERAGGALVMYGPRAAMMTNQERKRLRVIGHSLDASVLVGRSGISSEVIEATEAALHRHGIVKAKLTRACTLEKGAALSDLAWATGAQVVQRVGKTVVLYRADVALDPPVKRRGRR